MHGGPELAAKVLGGVADAIMASAVHAAKYHGKADGRGETPDEASLGEYPRHCARRLAAQPMFLGDWLRSDQCSRGLTAPSLRAALRACPARGSITGRRKSLSRRRMSAADHAVTGGSSRTVAGGAGGAGADPEMPILAAIEHYIVHPTLATGLPILRMLPPVLAERRAALCALAQPQPSTLAGPQGASPRHISPVSGPSHPLAPRLPLDVPVARISRPLSHRRTRWTSPHRAASSARTASHLRLATTLLRGGTLPPTCAPAAPAVRCPSQPAVGMHAS